MKAAIGWWGATVLGPSNRVEGRRHRNASCPTPNQNPAPPQRYMEEKKNTEKKRKTQKQERFSLVRKAKQFTETPD